MTHSHLNRPSNFDAGQGDCAADETRLIEQADIEVPFSDAPSCSTLNRLVRRRKAKRRALTAIAVGAAALFAVWITLPYGATGATGNSGPSQVVSVEPKMKDVARTNHHQMTDEQRSAHSPTEQRKRRRIQLYARLTQPLPVFDLGHDNKTIRHVGWVESHQSVPVDMDYVPESKLKPFDAVIFDGAEMDGEVWKVSL